MNVDSRARAFDLVIFDLDDTLIDLDRERRLAHLSACTGLRPERIHAAIWDSDFERAAERGAHATGDDYLRGFNERLGVPVTRAQWVAARAAATRIRPPMLDIVRDVRAHVPVALLTNNGALLRESLPELVPEVCALITERRHASCDFLARKPEPAVFTRLVGRYGVAPSRALFVDDYAEYTDGALQAGLDAIRYESAPQVRAALVAKGILD